ncbi:hypothetical protein JOM56_007402 [Amanita muscaria]
MPVLSLPLTFTNSFWSQDYRHGLDVLYRKLDNGLVENDQLIAFIRARINAEAQLAASLAHPASLGSNGFGADDGASLFMTFQGLQQESVSQSKLHDNVAKELVSLVINPFAEWAQGYKDRLKQSKSTVLGNWLRNYEQAQTDVQKLKQQYLTKTRRADEAEDDAKFAPTGTNPPDKYTTSPRLSPADAHQAPQRMASVSERISQRLRDIQQRGASGLSTSSTEETAVEEQPPPSVDKGKQRAIEDDSVESPLPMSPSLPKVDIPPEHIILGGVPFTSATVSQLLTRAASELRLRPVRFPVLGEYQDAFSGEEFITWLQESVKEFKGDIDIAENAAEVLTEQEGLLRRLGEFGNQFESSDDAYYQFRPRAFDLSSDKKEHRSSLQGENFLKRTNNLVNMVTKALNNNPNGDPPYVRARHEAEEADKTYRISVRKLDRHRLNIEERLEETLKTLERWEAERLRAVKTVLLQYQGIVANIPKALEQSNERSGILVSAYQPESDLIALIERYRTGPFRPTAHIYESVAHDEGDVVFGIDLRKWAEGGWQELTSGEERKDIIPPVFTALLRAVEDAYHQMPNDLEKRKSWIYEVPLVVVHQLREILNTVQPGQPFPPDLFNGYDAPVIANTIKLWLHELDPPLLTYESWEEFRKIYPGVGTKMEGEVTEEQRLQNVSSALQRLPKVHLYVLDALIKHLTSLVKSSAVEESDEVFIAKLALTFGRAIIRPKQETELSIQDRHPTLLFIDLMTKYESILPSTIAKKKRESERKVPTRKRTAPVDMRMSRSRISLGADTKELLAAQQAAHNPSLARTKSPAPPLPDLPKTEGQQTVAAPAISPTKPFVPPPPPPPPPLSSQATAVPVQIPPPPPLPTNVPAFKEPPPEQDDPPRRPTFKEPPPEVDDYTPPPMPKFVDPPAEDKESSSTPQPPAPPVTNIVPPSPLKATGTGTGGSKTGRTTPSSLTRSATPPSGDVTLGSGKSTIARSGSAQSNGGLRGPRLARGGPRRGGGTVASAIANLNRSSVSGPPSATAGRPASPTTNNRFSTGSPTRRPSSVLGRSAPLSRREDDVEGRQ